MTPFIEVITWGYPPPTNSGVREGLWVALHKNEQIIISLLVGGGYPQVRTINHMYNL